MKRLILRSFILCSVIFLSGCSYSTKFYVLNISDSPLQVEYVVNLKLNSVEHTQTKPFKMSLSDWDKLFGDKNEQEVSQNEYEFDTTTQKVKVKLNSNEVLRIVVDLSNGSEYYKFPLVNLHLNGNSGERIYSGEHFYKQFEKKDDYNYFIEYR